LASTVSGKGSGEFDRNNEEFDMVGVVQMHVLCQR